MGLNFPNSPSVGTQWPSPPQVGLPVYQWDGEKWTAGPPAIPDGLVHYDIAQTLTGAQRKQVIANTGQNKGLFSVNLNGVNNAGAGGGARVIPFSTKVVDLQTWFDTSSFKYTPQEAGYYYIVVGASTGAGSADSCQAIIYKNGVTAGGFSGVYVSAGVQLFSNVSGIVQMNGTTDFIQGACWVPTGSPGTILGPTDRTYMFGWKVGEL